MDNFKIKLYGYIPINKMQFLTGYILFSSAFLFLTIYFSFYSLIVPENLSYYAELLYKNFHLFWLLMLFWTVVEGMFFWNKFTKRQLEIITEQKIKIENQNIELNTQKEEISAQRDEIEAQRDELVFQRDTIVFQKKEIVDSINYAYRIQKAILPPDKYVNACLPDNFIFYRPKDVVSGDFYFVEKLGNEVVFSAVDCTGHGVPGAMMSVIGYNLLTQAVKVNHLTKPSEILKFLDLGVTETLRQTYGESGVNDGMDIAICSLNTETLVIQYSGAYNTLVLIKKTNDNKLEDFENQSSTNKLINSSTHQLIEVKSDKFPIGVNYDGLADSYTNNIIQLSKGDLLYMYSDGYADQFGGEKGKKFKYKPLKELLLSVKDETLQEQKNIIEKTFVEWKKDLEQVDDVLVMGVRI
ncbi:MAG: hypothetical protein A2046_12450 [Bacteroidetes bacterium GWA2_30_7]|nr:MAG: hypothetical protein A2046_12450 [Bacteroidetes bacterium GWA2_30_7]